MQAVGSLIVMPKIQKKLKDQMTDYIIIPYQKNCRAGKKHSKRITKNAADAFLLHQRRFSDGVCAIILFEISLSFDKVLSAQLQSYNPDL